MAGRMYLFFLQLRFTEISTNTLVIIPVIYFGPSTKITCFFSLTTRTVHCLKGILQFSYRSKLSTLHVRRYDKSGRARQNFI